MLIKINPRRPERAIIQKAVTHLRRGGLVIYPTETAYGLGADARNVRAVRRVFVLKRRAQAKALPVIVESVAAARRLVEFPEPARRLARRSWPGPLTLVLPLRRSSRLASGVRRVGTVAIRVSSHPIAQALARALDGPIISTSANLAGRGACYSIGAVLRQFPHPRADLLILDAGPLEHRKPSTIVRIDGEKSIVLRRGAVRPSLHHLANKKSL